MMAQGRSPKSKRDKVPAKSRGRRPRNKNTTKIRLPGAALEAAGSAVEYPDGGVSRGDRRARRSAQRRGTERDRPGTLLGGKLEGSSSGRRDDRRVV